MIVSLQKLYPFLVNGRNNTFSSKNPHNYQSLSLSYLFILALCFLMSGTIFFLASNWQAIPNLVKLVGIQVLFCLGILGYIRYGSTLGKISINCSALLVGVFLAVFGQVYQSGADSYILFLTWAIAIIPLALLSNLLSLWIMIFILTNISFYFLWKTLFPQYDEHLFLTVLTLFNGSVLFLREFFAKKFQALQSYSTRILPYLCTLGAVVYQNALCIVDFSLTIFNFSAPIILLFLYIMYRYNFKDVFICALNLISICFIIICYFLNNIELNIFSYICISLLVIILFSLVGKYLERIYKKFNTEKRSEEIAVDLAKNNKSFSKVLLKYCIFCISSFISVIFLSICAYLIYDDYAKDSYFLSIVGISSLLIAVFLYLKSINKQKENTYLLPYLGLTALLLGYIVIMLSLSLEYDFKEIHVSLTMFAITIILFPFVNSTLPRTLMGSFAVLLLCLTKVSPLFILLLNIIALIVITYKFFYNNTSKIIKDGIYTSFAVISVQELFLISDLITTYEKNFYMQFFTYTLALWVLVLVYLNIKKICSEVSNISKTAILTCIISLVAIIFFAYIQAHTILFSLGLLLLSMNLEKIVLLRTAMLLFIPLFSLYYYNLNLTLLYKSYTLLISGCILLVLCTLNKKVLNYEK